MKKSRLLSVLLCLALLSGLLATFASAADSGSAILDEMDVNAKAAVLVDPDTGEILYEKNAHAHNYPASITKVMTCLLTLEAVDRGELSLEQTVTASSALHTGIGEGASTADIKEGEQIRIIDLLYAALIPSANEACNVMAEAVSGDVASFVELMNTRAAELGMEHTHFENPNGLNDEGHYSTAADMAALARVVMEHEALAKIVGTRSITVAGRTLTNHNKLLWRYEGCTGLKTGYTDRAGRTLVSCAERDGQRLIAVTLNDPNDWADHAALFDYGFAHYRSAMLALANRTFRMLPVTGSLNRFVPVYTASDVYYPLTEGELVKARVELPERVEAPIQGGTIAGRLLFTLDGAVIGETYLLYAGDVADDRAGRGLFGRVLDWFRAGEADTLATVCCRWISDSNL